MEINHSVIDKIARKIVTTWTIKKLEFCYMDRKFVLGEIAEFKCPFDLPGFQKEKCRQCRYYAEIELASGEVD